MKALQKFGGFAALYMAFAYLIGMVIFLVVLDYPSITDPAQKVALIVDNADGHLFNQPAHVRVLWRFSDRPVAGVVRPLESPAHRRSCRWQP